MTTTQTLATGSRAAVALRRSDVVPEFNPQAYPPLQEFWEVGLKVEAWADGRMFRIEAKRDTRGGQVDG